MKPYLKSFYKVTLTILLFFEANFCISQSSENILFQAIAPSVTIRKFSFETSKQENFTAYYSAKHNEILLTKLDFERFPDNNLYLVKAKFTMFKARQFKDSPEQTFIRIDYYYLDFNNNNKEVEITCYRCTQKPSTGAIKDITQKDINAIHFIIDENSRWIMDNTGKADDAIIYVEQDKDMPILGYVLMIKNLKKIIVDGKQIN